MFFVEIQKMNQFQNPIIFEQTELSGLGAEMRVEIKRNLPRLELKLGILIVDVFCQWSSQRPSAIVRTKKFPLNKKRLDWLPYANIITIL